MTLKACLAMLPKNLVTAIRFTDTKTGITYLLSNPPTSQELYLIQAARIEAEVAEYLGEVIRETSPFINRLAIGAKLGDINRRV